MDGALARIGGPWVKSCARPEHDGLMDDCETPREISRLFAMAGSGQRSKVIVRQSILIAVGGQMRRILKAKCEGLQQRTSTRMARPGVA